MMAYERGGEVYERGVKGKRVKGGTRWSKEGFCQTASSTGRLVFSARVYFLRYQGGTRYSQGFTPVAKVKSGEMWTVRRGRRRLIIMMEGMTHGLTTFIGGQRERRPLRDGGGMFEGDSHVTGRDLIFPHPLTFHWDTNKHYTRYRLPASRALGSRPSRRKLNFLSFHPLSLFLSRRALLSRSIGDPHQMWHSAQTRTHGITWRVPLTRTSPSISTQCILLDLPAKLPFAPPDSGHRLIATAPPSGLENGIHSKRNRVVK